MTIALITGITGQDGSYLAEFLLARGYRVVGVTRDIRNARDVLCESSKDRLELVVWDMLNQHDITAILKKYRPTER